MQNIWLKIFSLLAALLLYFFVKNESNSSVLGFSVPIEFKNLPEDKTIVWPQHKLIQVSIRGPSYLVSSVAAQPPPFKVRFPDDVGLRYKLSLKKEDISLPPSVEIVSFEPTQVEFVFDKIITKDLRVVVPKIGTMRKGLKLGSITTTPEKITMKGPLSVLKDLESVKTAPLILDELTEPEVLDLPLELPLDGLDSEVSKVNVQVLVEGKLSK